MELGGIEQLVNLSVLDLADNSIRDLSPLSTMTFLTYLDLDNNDVEDILPLAGMCVLRFLALSRNRVADISPLLALPSLGTVELRGNPLDPATGPRTVSELRSRGVQVVSDLAPTDGPASDDSGRWESLGPEEQEAHEVNITDLAMSPADPRVMYASSETDAWGSRDGGDTWTRIAVTGIVFGVFVDPHDPEVLYLSQAADPHPWDVADWRSRDGGGTWDLLAILGPGNLLGTDGAHPGRLYATHLLWDQYAPEGTSDVLTVLRSDDYGASWSPVVVGGHGLPHAFVWAHPAAPEVVYCVIRSSPSGGDTPSLAVFRNENGGTAFDAHPIGRDLGAIAPDPTGVDWLYGIDDEGVWHSRDAGATWQLMGEAPREGLRSLLVNPLNARDLWTWGSRFPGLWHSEHAGVLWEEQWPSLGVRQVVLHPDNARRAYVVVAADTRSGRVHETMDAGASWQPVSIPARIPAVWSLSADGDGTVYAVCRSAPPIKVRSGDGGWSDVHATVQGGDEFSPSLLWADPRHAGIVYAYQWRTGWFRSADHGASWVPLQMSGRSSDRRPTQQIAASPEGAAVRYALDPGDAGLYRSGDNGLTWTLVAGDVEAFALDATSGGTIVVSGVSDRPMRVTRDGGVTWEVVGRLPGGQEVLDLAIHPLAPGRVYVSTRSGAYSVSMADGSVHHLLASRLDWNRRSRILLDPSDAEYVCVMWDLDLWESEDAGRSWRSLLTTAGSPLKLGDVAMDPRDPQVLYAATPVGVHRLHRSGSGTAIVEAEDLLPAGFGLQPNYPNPFNAATLIRYEVPATGRVELEVFSILGQGVARLVGEQQEAGFHRVVWDGRNASGRSVASGVYLCRLRAGSRVGVRRMLLLR